MLGVDEMVLAGNLISGTFDEENNAFSIQQIKYFTTETTLNEKQLNMLRYYLQKHQEMMEGPVITLYDQLPLRLSQEETKLLLADLDKIRTLYF